MFGPRVPLRMTVRLHKRLTQATALAAVAFLLLASGRALVPKVCATQNALGASCHEPVETVDTACCESEASTDSLVAAGAPPELTEGVHCALCVLATAVVLPLEHTDQPAPSTLVLSSANRVAPEPVLPTLWTPTLPRDPPAAV